MPRESRSEFTANVALDAAPAPRPFPPFREHGLWQCRGFTPSGLHFNRAFRTQRDAQQFMGQMAREVPGVPRY